MFLEIPIIEFTFEADPTLEVALGSESGFGDEEEVAEREGYEPWDLSGYDPVVPTTAKPGSQDKVKMLSARYAAGLPLWDPSDRYDHGPDDLIEALSEEEEEEQMFVDEDEL